jgi:hypothetical protein
MAKKPKITMEYLEKRFNRVSMGLTFFFDHLIIAEYPIQSNQG